MAYNASIPVVTNAPASDVSAMQENFSQIKTLVDVNHGDFASADAGKHTYVTMPTQTSLPTISSTEWSLFTASDSQLYLRTDSSGAIDLTKDKAITKALKTTTGWCMLPCGIVVKWGSDSVTSGSTATVSLANGSGIPDITTMLGVQVSPGYASTPEGNVFFRSYTNTSGANSVTVSAWKPFSGTITLTAHVLIWGI